MVFIITVDKDECIRCGACEAQCPEGFEVKDGKAKAKKDKVTELGCFKEAAAICPVNAIKVEEEK